MYKYIIILLFSFYYLYAQNPLPYAALGDKIYDNVATIEKLKSIGDYSLFANDIDRYIKEVKQTKKEGFALSKSSSREQYKAYLKKLRKLAEDNDYYMRAAENSFKDALKDENTTLFLQIIQSNIIKPQEHKKEILDYYFAHAKDINETGIIKYYLDEDKKLKAKELALRKKAMNKKRREEEKIKRIRQKDRLEQEALEKKLEEAVKKKKLQIREEQKEELINSI